MPASALRSTLDRIVTTLRAVARPIRYLPDRILHGARRSSARRSIARAAPIEEALFICYGNVCRSPFMAALFTQLAAESLPTSVRVTSAGFVGPDRQPPAPALAAAARRGLDMTEHRSMLITSSLLESADLIVVVSAEQRRKLRAQFGVKDEHVIVLGDLDPLPIQRRTIVDPWGCDDAVFDESYDRIDRCTRELVRALSTSGEKEKTA